MLFSLFDFDFDCYTISQEIGWEERRQYDLFIVELDE